VPFEVAARAAGAIPMLFISYRRDDSAGLAGRIYDRLQSCFGSDSVFMDVDSIPVGVDFRHYLTEAVGKCQVLLALIGERWLTAEQGGKRRLDDDRDHLAGWKLSLGSFPVQARPAVTSQSGQARRNILTGPRSGERNSPHPCPESGFRYTVAATSIMVPGHPDDSEQGSEETDGVGTLGAR
jgi:hypothetical protein